MRPTKVVGYDSHLSQFLFIINKRRNIQYFFALLLQNKQSRPRLILSRGILLQRFAGKQLFSNPSHYRYLT